MSNLAARRDEDSDDGSEETRYAEPSVRRVPNYEISERAFVLKQPNVEIDKDQVVQSILEIIKNEEMAPYYKYLCEEYLPSGTLQLDQALYSELARKNEEKVTSLKEKLAISTGAKIDIMFTITRLGFFFNDQFFVMEKLDQINVMIEKGGDWERRNRFKTYKGIHCLATRDFKEAANLLVDSLATFTSVELTSYENIATYASVAGLFTLERTELKSKVIDSPELLLLMNTNSALQSISSLTISLYTSDYPSFFPYLLETHQNVLLPCKYLSAHSDFFVREMRRKVYAQLLDSYKTLSLNSMAGAFGVSVDFLDNDLGKFIPNKQLNCVIDRVNGIVETNRPDNKNAQYHLLIKQGDGLLTKLQKYGAAVRLTGSDRVA